LDIGLAITGAACGEGPGKIGEYTSFDICFFGAEKSGSGGGIDFLNPGTSKKSYS